MWTKPLFKQPWFGARWLDGGLDPLLAQVMFTTTNLNHKPKGIQYTWALCVQNGRFGTKSFKHIEGVWQSVFLVQPSKIQPLDEPQLFLPQPLRPIPTPRPLNPAAFGSSFSKVLVTEDFPYPLQEPGVKSLEPLQRPDPKPRGLGELDLGRPRAPSQGPSLGRRAAARTLVSPRPSAWLGVVFFWGWRVFFFFGGGFLELEKTPLWSWHPLLGGFFGHAIFLELAFWFSGGTTRRRTKGEHWGSPKKGTRSCTYISPLHVAPSVF